MNFTVIFIGLLCFALQYGRGTVIVYDEGREAVLHFFFPRRAFNVTLQIGNRVPFYDNGRLLESGLSKGQFKRFQVKSHSNHHFKLILTISNVSREDEGTYVGLVYIAGEMETSLTKMIALAIDYPPGDPQCKFISPSKFVVIHDTWDIIECTADIGTMPGYIACFQNNEALPIHGNLVKNSTTLLQRLWVKRSQLFSCCSLDYRNSVNAESCTAYQLENNNVLTTPHYLHNSELNESHETSTMSTPFGEFISRTGLIRDNDYSVTGFQFSFSELVILIVVPLLVMIVLVVAILFIKFGREIVRGNRRNEELLNKTTEKNEALLRKNTEMQDEIKEELRKIIDELRSHTLPRRSNSSRTRSSLPASASQASYYSACPVPSTKAQEYCSLPAPEYSRYNDHGSNGENIYGKNIHNKC